MTSAQPKSYLVEYNGLVIGVYDSFDKAELFIKSCLQNNLMQNNAIIREYILNSCFYINKMVVTFNSNQLSQVDNKPIIDTKPESEKNISQPIKELDHDDPKVLEIAKQKLELQHKINLLKVQKKRIEESKRVYENDINLFNVFSENLVNDPNFVIPELFLDKFKLIKKLKEENNLSWESFNKEYKVVTFYGDYFGTNSYDMMFENNGDSEEENDNRDISEEFDIESDSDTDSSEDN
jgi:hypothetical protein